MEMTYFKIICAEYNGCEGWREWAYPGQFNTRALAEEYLKNMVKAGFVRYEVEEFTCSK